MDPQLQLFSQAQMAMQAGKLEQAIDLFESILKQQPGNVDARHYMGICNYQTGNCDKGFEQVQASLANKPNDSIFNSNYGLMLFEQKRFNEAEQFLIKAISLDSHNLDALLNLSILFMRTQRNQQAKKILLPLAEHHSQDFNIQVAYAQCLRDCGELQASVDQFKAVLKLRPDSMYEEIEYCGVLLRAGLSGEVEAIYLSLVEKYPDSLDVYINIIILYEKTNQLEIAESWIEKALARENFNKSRIFLEYAKLMSRKKRNDEALNYLQKINITELRETEVIHFHFECGAVFDRAGMYEQAFAEYKNGNQAKREFTQHLLDRKQFDNTLDLKINGYSAEKYRNLIDKNYQFEANHKPIFIVGFPRSGSTLVEKILASHRAISDGGEFNTLLEVQNECAELLDSTSKFPACLHELATHDDAQKIVTKLQQSYLDKVFATGLIDENKKWFTDKRLLTSLDLGFVRLLFPTSPIIHIIRHPLDACLSTYFTDFDVGHEYSLELSDTGYMFRKTVEQVEFSVNQFDLNFLSVRYEDILEKPDAEIARILSFIGEDWDDNCLEFYNNPRVARTASYAQVNQKLYTTSMYRYMNYREFIPEFIIEMQPVIDKLGYTT